MSNLGKKVLLYRTDISGKTPNISDVAIGELSLNYNANSPFLAFKDTNNELQKIGALSNNTGDSEFVTMSQKAITEALANYYTKSETYNKEEVNDLVNNLDIEHKLSETYESVTYPSVEETDGVEFIAAKANDTLDDAVKHLDQNISTLVQEVLNNEEVTAAAITEIKESVGLDENLKYVVNTEATYINNATSFAEADSLLDAAISNIINEIPSLDDYATKEYVDNLNNNLDIKHKLSETYESVTYPTFNGNAEFIAAKANDTLDDAVKHLDQNISTLVQEVIKDEDVIVSAFKNVKQSIGLDESFKYVTNPNSSYINSARSFSEADDLLDAAIKNVFLQIGNVDLSEVNEKLEEANNKISLLESKLNAIIKAVGLNSDGTFIVPTTAQTSGYTTAATSVMTAIHLMDNQIEENETVTAYALTDLNNRLEELDTKFTDFEKETNIS